ncbi:serine hydrolase domain-containing protein [Micropruina sonneratiae]|uniref:serine hydrolase domain-containing protein n=1 Tax=Micropruina sonneratiae TaxID=2986940 RepID=UPI0022266BF5|nr:serine hydrolase [Micropruina sp. KQZ13P-5]MCW3158538.1 beta-lactamase family protein [Micropruina sp. KQZ13P-5]
MRRRGRLWLRVLSGVVALLLIAVAGGYLWIRPLLRTGTGYAAHNACALATIAGRPITEDLPPNPLVPYLRVAADGAGYRASVLGFLAGQRAWPVEGFGCTVGDSPPDFGPATVIDPANNPLHDQPTPAASGELATALAHAFGDDLAPEAREQLGTRAVLVVSDGRIVAERYADGFSAETPQLGWSMAKSVTSLLTGVLVAKGVVTIADDHLRPEWTDERAAITVEDLMRMRSGLAWDETYDLGTPITQMLYDSTDMAGFVASQPLAHPVGTSQQYSSGSTNLLCNVLQARSGQGPDLPRKELLAPLGLSSAVFEADPTGTPVCSSYLWMTPRDWAAIGQFALDDGVWNGRAMIPEHWIEQTTTARTPASHEDLNYAAGWWTNRQSDGSLLYDAMPADAYWASGHDGQKLFVVPSQRLVVLRLGFSPSAEDIRDFQLLVDASAAVG